MKKHFIIFISFFCAINLYAQIDLKLRFSLNQNFTHEVAMYNTIKVKKEKSDLYVTIFGVTRFYFTSQVVKISNDSNYTFALEVKRVTMSMKESDEKSEFYDSDAKKSTKFQKETDESFKEVIGKKFLVTYNKYGKILNKDEINANIVETLFLELPQSSIKVGDYWETESKTTITEIETSTLTKNHIEKLDNNLVCGTSVSEIELDMLKFKEPLTSNFKINKDNGLLMYSKSKGVTEMFGMMEMTIEIETFVK